MLKIVFICFFLFVSMISILPVSGAYADTAQPNKETKKEMKEVPQEIDLPDDEGQTQPVREWGDDVENTWDEDSSWGDPFSDEGDDATRRALGYDGDGEND